MAAEGYILPNELPTFYDKRRVLQLASDDVSVPATAADLNNSASTPYDFVNNAVLSASADLDAHCQQGKRYTRADIEAMVEDANDNPSDSAKVKRAQAVKQLIADLSFGLMMSRRGHSADTIAKLAPRYEKAQEALEKLALGITVFDLDAAVDAGVPDTAVIGRDSIRPSLDNPMFGVWYSTAMNDPRLFGRW
jgi:hypothetical protein